MNRRIISPAERVKKSQVDELDVLVLNANFPTTGMIDSSAYEDIATNIGNSYIASSILKLFGLRHDNVFNVAQSIWAPGMNLLALTEASARCSWIFLNLQDHIRTSFPDEIYENALKCLKAIDVRAKMVAFSLAANSFDGLDMHLVDKLSPARRRFFDYLAIRCVSIGVRGPYTAEILGKMQITNVGVVGCPSYFEGGVRRRVESPEQRSHLSCIGLTGNFRSNHWEKKYLYLQGDAEWDYIRMVYANDSVWQSERGSLRLAENFDIELLHSYLNSMRFYTSSPDWKTHVAENCELVCGTRLHGAIVALNAGVPAIVTNGDARAQDTCEFFGIPWYPSFDPRNSSKDAIIKAADPTQLNLLYDTRRSDFFEWLRSIGLNVDHDHSEAELAMPSIQRRPSRVIAARLVETLDKISLDCESKA